MKKLLEAYIASQNEEIQGETISPRFGNEGWCRHDTSFQVSPISPIGKFTTANGNIAIGCVVEEVDISSTVTDNPCCGDYQTQTAYAVYGIGLTEGSKPFSFTLVPWHQNKTCSLEQAKLLGHFGLVSFPCQGKMAVRPPIDEAEKASILLEAWEASERENISLLEKREKEIASLKLAIGGGEPVWVSPTGVVSVGKPNRRQRRQALGA